MDWEVRLDDALSSPAARMAKALGELEDKLRLVDKQAKSAAIDKMTDGLQRQRAQLRLQRGDLQASLRQQQSGDRAALQSARAAERARSAAARDERVQRRAAESQSRLEARAKASADRALQRSAQGRQRLDEQVRRRQVAELAASARAEQRQQAVAQRAQAAAQRLSNKQVEAQNRSRIQAENRAQNDIKRAAVQAERDRGRIESRNARERERNAEAWKGDGSMALPLPPGQAAVLMTVAKAALAASAAVGTLAAAFAKSVLSAVDFRRSTLGALETLQKSKSRANETYEMGIELAARFHMDPEETIQQMHSLVSKGFKAKDARMVITALADLKVLAPNANMSALTLAIEQIKGKGVLSMEELNQQLAEAGLSSGAVIEQLAKKLGRSTAQIRKDISAGKITADQGIEGIINAIKKMGNGKVGGAAEKAAHTSLSGLVDGIKTNMALARLALAKGLDKSQGVSKAYKAMDNIVRALNPETSPGMKGLVGAASGFANELLTQLFGPISDKGAADTMQKVLNRITDGVKTLTKVVRTVGPIISAAFGGFGEGFGEAYDTLVEVGGEISKAFGGDKEKTIDKVSKVARTLGKVFGYVVVGVMAAVGAVLSLTASMAGLMGAVSGSFGLALAVVGTFFDDIKAKGQELLDAGSTMGRNLWQGFVNGIDSGISAVLEAGTRLANAAKSAVATALDQHSPSRVMMAMGGFTSEGFRLGLLDGMPGVQTAMADVVAPPPVAAIGAGAATGGAGSTGATMNAGGITVNVTVQGGATSDAKDIAAEVRRAVAEALESILQQMGGGPVPST